MVPTSSPDPVAALREFIDRVAPYDPDPVAEPRGRIEFRYGHAVDVLPITPYVAEALREALARYRDPADRGHCASCGGRHLDENLHCRDCGGLHGVLGALLAERAERFGPRTGGPDT